MRVVTSWLADLHGLFKEESLLVTDIRIGVFYTAAELATGEVGVAFTPRDLADTVCCPRSAATGPLAGQLAGQEAWTLAEYALSPLPLRRAVGMAVLNALSALAMHRIGVPGGQILRGTDALEIAGVLPDDRVTLVGSFVPFIKALKNRVKELWVVDKHREALKPEELPLWRSPEQALEAVRAASVVIATGSALVEGGMDELLAAAHSARRVVLAGPTASPWPPPFFERGVHVLGGIRVLDGRKMLQLVSEGGAGYAFRQGAEKICIVRD